MKRYDMETLHFHSLKLLVKIHRNYTIIVTWNVNGAYCIYIYIYHICTSHSSCQRYISVNCRIKANGQLPRGQFSPNQNVYVWKMWKNMLCVWNDSTERYLENAIFAFIFHERARDNIYFLNNYWNAYNAYICRVTNSTYSCEISIFAVLSAMFARYESRNFPLTVEIDGGRRLLFEKSYLSVG